MMLTMTMTMTMLTTTMMMMAEWQTGKAKKETFARGSCAVRVLACRIEDRGEVEVKLRGSLILIVCLPDSKPARHRLLAANMREKW